MSQNDLYNFRKSLPIWKSKRQIIEIIFQYKTIILIGETGCGKSTQVPQFLVDSEEMKGYSIAITQPRRVSACSLAKRVSKERNRKLGGEVGYNVRFDNMSCQNTKIKYVTDGMLLREILSDPNLSNYNIIILDEIHERTVQTDLLIGLLKDLQKKRDIKLVLMSATLHCQLFVDFFDSPPIIHIKGRTFPVSVFYTEEPETDYIDAAALSIIQLNSDLELPGDFLVFLTGQEEIEEITDLLNSKTLNPPIVVLPLYAALPMYQQQLVFEPISSDKRKIILSTNIAETSVTIPGIKYVIDTGLVKVKSYNPISGIEVLGVTPISKAQALQRTGRAGRESAGGCFRLYTEDQFFKLKDSPVAEIRRADLSSVVLQLFSLGISNPLSFEFLERPPTELITSSIKTIWSLGGINDEGELTEDGNIMAKFPLTPRMTKILLLASRFGCGESALILLSMMSTENLFINPADLRKKARNEHSVFVDPTGDHITLINIFNEYLIIKEDKRIDFCKKKFLSKRALDYAINVKEQLLAVIKELNINIIEDLEDENRLERLRQCLCISNKENVAIQLVSGKYQCIEDGTEIYIHPSSFLFGKGPYCICFSERVQTKRLYARWVSISEQNWVNLNEPIK